MIILTENDILSFFKKELNTDDISVYEFSNTDKYCYANAKLYGGYAIRTSKYYPLRCISCVNMNIIREFKRKNIIKDILE